MWEAIAIVLAVMVYAAFSKGGNAAAGNVPFPEANTPIAPATPAAIDASNDQLTDQIAFDIQTGSTRVLKVGETIISAGFAGVSALAASGTTATTTGTLLFTATSWTIIGGVVAGAFAVIMALRSNTHLYANELVNNYENPFGQYFISTQQKVEANLNLLQSIEVKQIYNGVFVAWGNYRAVMLDLIARGGDWAIVAKQSLNNLNNEFSLELSGRVGMGGLYPDGFVTTWFRWYEAVIANLEQQGR